MTFWKVALAASVLSVVTVPAGSGFAADPTREDVGRAVKVPQTAADHAALAKMYDEKAAEWRAEADYHKKMADAYKAAKPESKDAQTMQKHCSMVAKDADDMANQAQVMADYHRLRSKEAK